MTEPSTNKTLSSRVIGTQQVPWRNLKFLQSDAFKELSPASHEKLKHSIVENKFSQPFYVWQDGDTIYCLDGKHRTSVLHELESEGLPVPDELPATFIECKDKKEAAKLVLVYSSMYANVTSSGLTDFMQVFDLSLDDIRFDVDLPEFDMLSFQAEALGEGSSDFGKMAFDSLQDSFIVPPFSVIDTRQGYWQERKRKWNQLGINSQATREEVVLISKSGQGTAVYELRNTMRAVLNRDPTWSEILAEAKKKKLHIYEGASIFDPVLCEVMYRWFCPDGAIIGDPFAGGIVRGIVAALLGYDYHGVDLRPEQVAENRMQLKELTTNGTITSEAKLGALSWHEGDSLNIDEHLPAEQLLDFLFSCPPYHDLEKYSKDERDLSNMEYSTFKEVYRAIISKWVARLRENRFACFVVSEIRDKKGAYRNFVSDTISAFTDAGCIYYNEIILLNVAGSLPIRVGKQFIGGRKVGRTHQNILVFFKGDPDTIKEQFPKITAEEIFGEALDINQYQPNIALSVID